MYALTVREIQDILISAGQLREVIHQSEWYYTLDDQELLESLLTQIDHHSKNIDQPAIFICKGLNFKEDFLKDAVHRGAEIYISENLYENIEIPGIIVNDIRKSMAILAKHFYQKPDEDLQMIGLTGTKGKTTSNYFIHHMIEEAYPGQVAFISTIDYCLDGEHTKVSDLTTPESLDLYRMLAEARDHQMKYLVMEVSSQAYKLDRVFGIHFDLGLFLNFSDDHIGVNEHPHMEDYFYCKRQLMHHSNEFILYNDLPYLELLVDELELLGIPVHFYGPQKQGYQVIASREQSDKFLLENSDDYLSINGVYQSPLPGLFNFENAAVALLSAKILGIDPETAQRGLLKAEVSGRMEKFELPSGAIVYVDYAHNYDSLRRLLIYMTTEYPKRQLSLLIGATGGKGQSRRAGIGKVAGDYCDRVIFTTDDPNYDDPKLIADELRSYMEKPVANEYIEDREKAVQMLLEESGEHDVIVLASKGNDQMQIINGEYVPYPGDISLVKQFIKKSQNQH